MESYVKKDGSGKSPWKYYVDFFTFPGLFALIAWYDFPAAGPKVAAQWIMAAFAGFVLFTFVEYWVHRVVLHRFFYHGTHEDHHKFPEAHVAFPIYYTPAIFSIIFAVFWAGGYLTGNEFWLAGFEGFVLGFMWFSVMHHLLHHDERAAATWLKTYSEWHLVHHRAINYNYGITTNIWDRVFRTYRAGPMGK